MKPTLLIASLAFLAAAGTATAATDRSYYVTQLAAQQKFDVYNDGHNTYLESIPGLVVTGATADGERYIVNGVPQQIQGFMNGKPITIVRGTPPQPKPAVPDPAIVNAQIKQLTEKLDSLTAKVQPTALTMSPAAAIAATTPPQGRAAAGGSGEAASSANAKGVAQAGATTSPRPLVHPMITDVIPYRVSPKDENLRLLIERWARPYGWTAVWDVDRDIPIGSFGGTTGDFKTAVRWVLSATELSDLVVKPCFYSNSVVRIVRKTVKCNPNE